MNHDGRLTRSQINRSIERAKEVYSRLQIYLPPFAFWSIDDWHAKGAEADEIRDCMLGWDGTDFGSRDFGNTGRTLFTLRNGNVRRRGYPKSYAEKLILDPEGQRAPAHFHQSKTEDIINRVGGNVLVQLTRATPDNKRSDETFTAQVNGETVRMKPGGVVRLEPGESVCITPRTIHQFWGEEGTGLRIDGVGHTVSYEVSSVCDDLTDNFFLEDMTRFPQIDEDEPRRHYLCHEYPRVR